MACVVAPEMPQGRQMCATLLVLRRSFRIARLRASSSSIVRACSSAVSNRAGAAEFVVEGGVTGVLVPPGDADALVAALEPLMRDPAAAAAMGARGRARGEGKFSLDAEPAAIAAVDRNQGAGPIRFDRHSARAG